MLRYFCVKIPQATAAVSVSNEDSDSSRGTSLQNGSNYCMVLALVRPTSKPYEVFNFVIDVYFSFDSLANLVTSLDTLQESKKEELISYMRRFSVRYDQVVLPMKDALNFYTNLGFHSTVLQSSTEMDVTCSAEKPIVDQLLAHFSVDSTSLFVNVEHFMILDFRRFSTRKYYRHISRILNWLNRSVSTCLRGYVNREIFSHVLRLSQNVASVVPPEKGEEEVEIDVCGTVIDNEDVAVQLFKDRARREQAELRRVTASAVLATPPEEARVLRKRRAPTVPLLLKRKKIESRAHPDQKSQDTEEAKEERERQKELDEAIRVLLRDLSDDVNPETDPAPPLRALIQNLSSEDTLTSTDFTVDESLQTLLADLTGDHNVDDQRTIKQQLSDIANAALQLAESDMKTEPKRSLRKRLASRTTRSRARTRKTQVKPHFSSELGTADAETTVSVEPIADASPTSSTSVAKRSSQSAAPKPKKLKHERSISSSASSSKVTKRSSTDVSASKRFSRGPSTSPLKRCAPKNSSSKSKTSGSSARGLSSSTQKSSLSKSAAPMAALTPASRSSAASKISTLPKSSIESSISKSSKSSSQWSTSALKNFVVSSTSKSSSSSSVNSDASNSSSSSSVYSPVLKSLSSSSVDAVKRSSVERTLSVDRSNSSTSSVSSVSVKRSSVDPSSTSSGSHTSTKRSSVERSTPSPTSVVKRSSVERSTPVERITAPTTSERLSVERTPSTSTADSSTSLKTPVVSTDKFPSVVTSASVERSTTRRVVRNRATSLATRRPKRSKEQIASESDHSPKRRKSDGDKTVVPCEERSESNSASVVRSFLVDHDYGTIQVEVEPQSSVETSTGIIRTYDLADDEIQVSDMTLDTIALETLSELDSLASQLMPSAETDFDSLLSSLDQHVSKAEEQKKEDEYDPFKAVVDQFFSDELLSLFDSEETSKSPPRLSCQLSEVQRECSSPPRLAPVTTEPEYFCDFSYLTALQ